MIALILVGFVLTTMGVIARRVAGVRHEAELLDLQQRRDALAAERAKLEAAIRDAASRAKLQPIAEQRLNMSIPKADQQVFLSRRPPGPPARHDSL
jgi:cell division protein FtsL